jgi:hypothetical protein
MQIEDEDQRLEKQLYNVSRVLCLKKPCRAVGLSSKFLEVRVQEQLLR